MPKLDLSDLKIIKKELYGYLNNEKFNYYMVAQLCLSFRKNLEKWEVENKNNFNQFKKRYKKIQSKILPELLSELAKISYYKKELSKQEAYNFLKELNSLEKNILKLDSFENNNIYKKTG